MATMTDPVKIAAHIQNALRKVKRQGRFVVPHDAHRLAANNPTDLFALGGHRAHRAAMIAIQIATNNR